MCNVVLINKISARTIQVKGISGELFSISVHGCVVGRQCHARMELASSGAYYMVA